MRSSYSHYAHFVNQVIQADIPGVFAEFGVWRGENFLELAKTATAAGRTAIAVDSFEGMADPTPQDAVAAPGTKQQYPRGALSVVGTPYDYDHFIFRLNQAGVYSNTVVYRGFIPEVLYTLSTPTLFAITHIDLDHYWPTLATINYVWPRTTAGGYMVIHDYFKDNTNLAAGAVNFWRLCTATPVVDILPSRHIIFRKD